MCIRMLSFVYNLRCGISGGECWTSLVGGVLFISNPTKVELGFCCGWVGIVITSLHAEISDHSIRQQKIFSRIFSFTVPMFLQKWTLRILKDHYSIRWIISYDMCLIELWNVINTPCSFVTDLMFIHCVIISFKAMKKIDIYKGGGGITRSPEFMLKWNMNWALK